MLAVQLAAALDGPHEELEGGLRSIAVPIRSRSGPVVAAINLAFPWSPAPMSELADQFRPLLQGTARQISSLMI
jgi:IclR family transcriptional regulator, pca regulon regulatory protein